MDWNGAGVNLAPIQSYDKKMSQASENESQNEYVRYGCNAGLGG